MKKEETTKQEITKEEAINIITQVCSVYKGTLQEHVTIQQAIEVLKK